MNNYIEKVYILIKQLKEENKKLEKVSSTVEKSVGPELIVATLPLDAAQNLIVQYITKSKAFKNGSKPNIGDFKRSYGYGKVIGIKSLDDKVQTRIDFNPDKGYHFHFEDYRKDKPVNYCVIINNMTQKAYEEYIDTLSKRFSNLAPKDIKEESMEVLFYKKYKVNIELLKTVKKIYNYDLLNNINPYDNLNPEPFELICTLEQLIQKGISPKYRTFLNNYLNRSGIYSNFDGFCDYLRYFKNYIANRDEEIFSSLKSK